MFKIIFMVMVTLGSLPLTAADEPTLEDHMEVVGEQFGKLALAIRGKKVGNDELVATEKLQAAAAEGAMIYPELADSEEKKAEYSLLMADLVRNALFLENHIEAVIATNEDPQDLTLVTETFLIMNEIRQKGHDLFKETEE